MRPSAGGKDGAPPSGTGLRRHCAPTGASPLALCAIYLIRGYQIFISPLLGVRCRFYPSCSHYALAVFREWGFFKGSWLTLRRLAKCGPWHEGGYDPPPRRGDSDIDFRTVKHDVATG